MNVWSYVRRHMLPLIAAGVVLGVLVGGLFPEYTAAFLALGISGPFKTNYN